MIHGDLYPSWTFNKGWANIYINPASPCIWHLTQYFFIMDRPIALRQIYSQFLHVPWTHGRKSCDTADSGDVFHHRQQQRTRRYQSYIRSMTMKTFQLLIQSICFRPNSVLKPKPKPKWRIAFKSLHHELNDVTEIGVKNWRGSTTIPSIRAFRLWNLSIDDQLRYIAHPVLRFFILHVPSVQSNLIQPHQAISSPQRHIQSRQPHLKLPHHNTNNVL